MNRWILGLFLVIVSSGLMATPADAQTVTLTATLSGDQEVPPVQTGSFGTAEVTIDLAAKTITYKVDVYNFPSGLTAAHIHISPKGISGPVILPLVTTPNISNEFTLSGTLTAANFGTSAANLGVRSFDDAIQSMVGGQSYVNVHSVVYPGGEIRGQLAVKQ